MLRNVLVLGVVAALVTLSCAHVVSDMPRRAALPASQTGGPIVWRHWGAEAFAEAERENKIVLVDVGIEGCTACRWR